MFCAMDDFCCVFVCSGTPCCVSWPSVFDSGMMIDDWKMAFTPVTTFIFIKLMSKSCSNILHYMVVLKRSYKIRLYLQHVSVAATTSITRESLLRKLQQRFIKTVSLCTHSLDRFASFVNVKMWWTYYGRVITSTLLFEQFLDNLWHCSVRSFFKVTYLVLP